MPLGRAGLAQHTSRPPLRDAQLPADPAYTPAAPCGAAPCPSAASFSIDLSRVRSATARLSRAFSRSRSFSRLSCSTFNPLYYVLQRESVGPVMPSVRNTSTTVCPPGQRHLRFTHLADDLLGRESLPSHGPLPPQVPIQADS